jgi:primosomal protein N' (replication factor Y) (superfamily II helicase)
MNAENESSRYAKVAFDLKVGKKLEYEVPEYLRNSLHIGSRVKVPLGSRTHVGYVVGFEDTPSFSPLKQILGLADSELIVPENIMSLARWMSDYYCTELGMVLKSVVPAPVRKEKAKFRFITIVRRAVTIDEMREKCKQLQLKARKQAQILEHMLNVVKEIPLDSLCSAVSTDSTTVKKLVAAGLLTTEKVRHDRDIFENESFLSTEPKQFTLKQKEVFDRILADVLAQRHAVHLIHGVTSSGKTEVYLQIISEALKLGRSAIVLVPEISLTPQTIERFRSRFGDTVSVLHHRLSEGERHDEWHKLYEGRSHIAVGARSAIFAPVQNLGLIVVDEEHEKSYKQGDIEPTYNARDIAVVRGKNENAVVILGSATPSMESYYNAIRGKYVLSELPERIDDRPMPTMRVIDMTKGGTAGMHTIFSDDLMNGIEKRLERGEQVILFLNRRGYATVLSCRGCKKVVTCPNCTLPLRFHREENILLCHICGHVGAVIRTCPDCRADTVLQKGFGTEKIERMLHAIFPQATIARMDTDTTRKKRSHDEILREFKSGKAQILVGTQMIAKGLHFPNVTLVGIVSADTALYIQDFRASEVTYQLITQVSGRAGRGEVAGEVVIQTSMPDHFAIKAACHHSYKEFFDHEIENRKILKYPPLLRLVAITVKGSRDDITRKLADDLRKELDEEHHPGIEILGPAEAPLKKAKGEFRYQLFLKSTRVSAMTHLVSSVVKRMKIPSSARISMDVDPVEML